MPPRRRAGRISTPTAGSLFHIEADRSQCHDLAAEQPEKLEELKALWFSEAAKYNGLPLADLNIVETLTRFRPYLVGDRQTYMYYPDGAEVGIGATAETRGQSFSVLADVTVDTTGAEGVLFKHGGAHGGHVLFIQDGRLHYVYNFLGEREQLISSPDAVPLGRHLFGVRFSRTGTVENSHTPLGELTLFVDDTAVGTLAESSVTPGHSAWRGAGITVGRNGGSAVSSRYKAPFAFTGGTIAQATSTSPVSPTWTWKGNSRLPFRATELGRAMAVRCLRSERAWSAGAVAGCEKTTAGTAVRASHATSTPSFDPAEPVPGVAATRPDHIPPNALVCVAPNAGSGHPTSAVVPDPEAPKIILIVPDGWSSLQAPVISALTLTGPDGMSGAGDHRRDRFSTQVGPS